MRSVDLRVHSSGYMRVLAVSLLLPGLLAAQPPVQTFEGEVASVAADHLTVRSDARAATVLYADPESRIWRGKTGNSLSVIRPGDEVSVRYRVQAGGRLVIVDLWANIDHVWGRITSVTAGQFEVDQNFNADPQSAYRRQARTVFIDADTQFQGSAAGDLRPGRTVDIIGAKTGASGIQASRIIVYEGNAPVRMPSGTRVIAPDGTVHTSK